MLIYFNGWFGYLFISKELALKEPLDIMLNPGNRPDSQMSLRTNRTVGKRLLASDVETVSKTRLILSKSLLIFFKGWYGNSFISKELALKEPLDDVMVYLGNCSDIQIALRTDHFVDRTF